MQQFRIEPTSCANVRGADSTVYDTTQISERPVPRTVPKLEYPLEARRLKLQGRAVVTAVVSAEGVVEPASLTIATTAQPLLDAEARRIVSLATFWPGCRDGTAVRARIAVPFEFRVSGDKAGLIFGVIAALWAGMMAAAMN